MSNKNVKYIRIFDTTLRDGEQTPGVSLTIEDKIEIAHQSRCNRSWFTHVI